MSSGSIMSDLDTLVVTFQTQMSDVMEAVVKMAMFEVTKLVEDVFLVEMKRSQQEVESLRLQLQRGEEQIGGEARRCADRASSDDPSPEGEEVTPMNAQDDVCDERSQDISAESWMPELVKEDKAVSPHKSVSPRSPKKESQATVEVKVLEIKEEVNKLSCSLHLQKWSNTVDCEAGPSLDKLIGPTETQPVTQENSAELLTATLFKFPKDQVETDITEDQPNMSCFEHKSNWNDLTSSSAAVLQNHSLEMENKCDPITAKVVIYHAEHNTCNSAKTETAFSTGRDPATSSESPEQQPNNVLSVNIKQELIDSEGCRGNRLVQKRTQKVRSPSFSLSHQSNRMHSNARRPNQLSQKAPVQEAMKSHSFKGAEFRLQTSTQHLRTTRKLPHTHPGPTSAVPTAQCQAPHLSHLNRVSSCKAPAAPPLSVQRIYQGDKRTSALNRTGASWVGVRSHSQSANSHQTDQDPPPDSLPFRQLLRCGQCGKCFPHPSNLKAHLQTHTGERPFCCSLCGRSFTKLSNLKAHRRVHTGERPYSCVACGKRFTQKCNLKRHQRIHLDV